MQSQPPSAATQINAQVTNIQHEDDDNELDLGGSTSDVVLSTRHSLQPCTAAERLEYDLLLNNTSVDGLNAFWQQKFEADNGKKWDIFYKQVEDRFFKHRYWIAREFVELHALLPSVDTTVTPPSAILLEVGCGVGNTLFPLLAKFPSLITYGFDVSKRAIQHIEGTDKYKQLSPYAEHNAGAGHVNRLHVAVFDITQTVDSVEQYPFKLPQSPPLQYNAVNYMTCIFVLSSLSLQQVQTTLHNLYQLLAVDGTLFIRDYAIYDLAELRFSPKNKLTDHFYVRRDGTRSQFFDLQRMVEVLIKTGFTVVYHQYVIKEVQNRKSSTVMARRFIQIRASKRAAPT